MSFSDTVQTAPGGHAVMPLKNVTSLWSQLEAVRDTLSSTALVADVPFVPNASSLVSSR